ncbi:hypothetical protein Back11_07410 [Paenibacillus baekrokdamisoli]|uniref:CN hydrolase domain-containing protein n=1 Tax=Paenibacillus baekrokdamisoli TaxID=1712516 RepID=A0A3G9IM58_9BACL|nr:hypothetical protein [Paenibacillus baekrokdamisoli]BBH19396.1 hypothetical protein Back11_07410 [Paenibacillus baekrokdamisoli]
MGERLVRVATTYIKPTEDFATNLGLILEVIDKSGSSNPDIICLTETFYEASTIKSFQNLREFLPYRVQK